MLLPVLLISPLDGVDLAVPLLTQLVGILPRRKVMRLRRLVGRPGCLLLSR